MKILKSKKPILKMECPACHSLLEIEPSDIISYHNGTENQYYGVDCPVCNYGIEITYRTVAEKRWTRLVTKTQ